LKRLIDKTEPLTQPYSFAADIPLEKYVAQKNITNFGEQLRVEFDPGRLQMLKRLLAIEKEKMRTISAATKRRAKASPPESERCRNRTDS